MIGLVEYPPRWALLRWHGWEFAKLQDNKPFFKEIVAPVPPGEFIKFKRTNEIVMRFGENAIVYESSWRPKK